MKSGTYHTTMVMNEICNHTTQLMNVICNHHTAKVSNEILIDQIIQVMNEIWKLITLLMNEIGNHITMVMNKLT